MKASAAKTGANGPSWAGATRPGRARVPGYDEVLSLQGTAGNNGVEALLSGGRPLGGSARPLFEGLFRQDFGSVRLHDDHSLPADLLASATGEHIALSPAVHRLGPPRSAAVLAHELAHVVQQRRGGAPGAVPAPALEADAHQAAASAVHGVPARVTTASGVAAMPLSWAEARRGLWNAVPPALQPALRPLATQAAAVVDKVIPPSTELPPSVATVVQSTVAAAQTARTAATPVAAAARRAVADPVRQAASQAKGTARDVVQRNLGRGKGIALEVSNVADILVGLPHMGRDVAYQAVDAGVLSGVVPVERANQARSAIKQISAPYDMAIAMATKEGLVHIDDVTGTPSVGAAVAGKFDSWSGGVDQFASAAGAAPEQHLVFTELEIGELESMIGINVLLSMVGAKEAEVALKLLGALGAFKSLIDLVERGGWVKDAQFWLRLIAVVAAILGLRNARVMGKITKIIMAAGSLANAVDPMLQLYKDWKDPALQADPKRRRTVLFGDLKAVAGVVVMAIKDAVTKGMSGRVPDPGKGAAPAVRSGGAAEPPPAARSSSAARPGQPVEPAPAVHPAPVAEPVPVAHPAPAAEPVSAARPAPVVEPAPAAGLPSAAGTKARPPASVHSIAVKARLRKVAGIELGGAANDNGMRPERARAAVPAKKTGTDGRAVAQAPFEVIPGGREDIPHAAMSPTASAERPGGPLAPGTPTVQPAAMRPAGSAAPPPTRRGAGPKAADRKAATAAEPTAAVEPGATATPTPAKPAPTVTRLPYIPPKERQVTARPTGKTPQSAHDAAALQDRGRRAGNAYPRDPLHHVLPQEFREFFKGRGIDVDDYAVVLSEGEHTATHTMKWNPKWKEWIQANPKATADETFAFARKMVKESKLDDHPLVRYTKSGALPAAPVRVSEAAGPASESPPQQRVRIAAGVGEPDAASATEHVEEPRDQATKAMVRRLE